MVLDINLDKKLMESDKANYKLKSVYEKNGLVHVKFETKYGMHRGTFKKNKLYINPETKKQYLYDEIEKAVKKLFNVEVNKKKYSPGFTDDIDKIFEAKDPVVPMSTEKSVRETTIEQIVEKSETIEARDKRK